MDEIVTAFRAFLHTLIDNEQRRLNLDTQGMLTLMQQRPALPDFYRLSAQAAAAGICNDRSHGFPQDALSSALGEAIKAVYGAWIREHYRTV